METNLTEWLHLLLRWIHVITGIMWIGNSFHFMWMDRNLTVPSGSRKNLIGEIWMIHSGGYYQVEKMHLAPNQMPKVLHWFRWEAGLTWISGFFLLSVVYYLSGGSFLIDPSVSSLSAKQATALGLGTLVLSWILYDLLFSSKLAKTKSLQSVMTYAVLILGCGLAYFLTHMFSGRAAFIHFGAVLGTLMAGNVWMRILPAQRLMVAATKSGHIPDPTLALRAKARSVHNNYMTLPLIFIMISNHYPMTYGHSLNWVVLIVLMIAGALVRHFMNTKNKWSPWVLVAAMSLILFLIYFTSPREKNMDSLEEQELSQNQVTFPQVKSIIMNRCLPCHAAHPADSTFGANPGGVNFEQDGNIKNFASRIKFRAVTTKTMPILNKTNITDAERQILGQWVDQGAPFE